MSAACGRFPNVFNQVCTGMYCKVSLCFWGFFHLGAFCNLLAESPSEKSHLPQFLYSQILHISDITLMHHLSLHSSKKTIAFELALWSCKYVLSVWFVQCAAAAANEPDKPWF